MFDLTKCYSETIPGRSVLAALAALLVLEPYLLTAPEVLQRNDFSDDFGYSVQVARGEILRPWSLADMHTVPFLHYWTQLWPQAVGIPLTVLFALGLAYALWRREWRGLVLVCWCGLYFLTIGGLHTKHVRYLLPLLPGAEPPGGGVLCCRPAPMEMAGPGSNDPHCTIYCGLRGGLCRDLSN